MVLLLLSGLVSGYIFTESQWISSDSCSGSAPDSIVAFETADPYNYLMPGNESWPSMYSFYQRYTMQYPECGVVYEPLFYSDSDCCVQNLKGPRYAAGYMSGQLHLVSSQSDVGINPFSKIPRLANGAMYCVLRAVPDSDPSLAITSLKGYQGAMVLSHGGCVESSFRCHPNGTLAFYTDPEDLDCTGNAEFLALESEQTSFSLPYLGTVVGYLATPTDGGLVPSWTASLPLSYMVSGLHTSMEWLALVIWIVSVLALLVGLFLNVQEATRRLSTNVVLYTASQSLYLVTIIIQLQFMYVRIVGTAKGGLAAALLILIPIAQLSSSIVTAKYVMDLMHLKLRVYVAVYASLVLLNVAVNGFFYSISFAYDFWESVMTESFATYLDYTQIIYPTLVLLFDLLPTLYLLHQILTTSVIPKRKWLATVYHADPVFFFTLLADVGTVLLWLSPTLVSLWDETSLGSDRNVQAINSFSTGSFGLHGFFVCLLGRNVRNVFNHARQVRKMEKLAEKRELKVKGDAVEKTKAVEESWLSDTVPMSQ
ncbi:hypothetical protein HDV03_000872 [Kappamyces sp. JEL0829]|nr:hypothetical protein HDV03_000872 [Kappamyces sp. JEL0829]